MPTASPVDKTARVASTSADGVDTEQIDRDIPPDSDSVPTLRKIPLAISEPDARVVGGIIFLELDRRWHAFAPDAVWLGDYATETAAQSRLAKFFGRPSLAKTRHSTTGVRRKPDAAGGGER